MVSPFKPGGKWPATSNPSCMAISAPATPLSALVFCTISLGVQFLRPGCPKTSPISCGRPGAAATCDTGAGATAGRTGTLGALGAGVRNTGGAGAGGAADVAGMGGAADVGGAAGAAGAGTRASADGVIP